MYLMRKDFPHESFVVDKKAYLDKLSAVQQWEDETNCMVLKKEADMAFFDSYRSVTLSLSKDGFRDLKGKRTLGVDFQRMVEKGVIPKQLLESEYYIDLCVAINGKLITQNHIITINRKKFTGDEAARDIFKLNPEDKITLIVIVSHEVSKSYNESPKIPEIKDTPILDFEGKGILEGNEEYKIFKRKKVRYVQIAEQLTEEKIKDVISLKTHWLGIETIDANKVYTKKAWFSNLKHIRQMRYKIAPSITINIPKKTAELQIIKPLILNYRKGSEAYGKAIIKAYKEGCTMHIYRMTPDELGYTLKSYVLENKG